jgi:hypothetical protein
MATKNTKIAINILNDNEIPTPKLSIPKYTKVGVFGKKIYHLATLFGGPTFY